MNHKKIIMTFSYNVVVVTTFYISKERRAVA